MPDLEDIVDRLVAAIEAARPWDEHRHYVLKLLLLEFAAALREIREPES